MEITLKLFAALREHLEKHHNGTCTVEVPDSAAVHDILEKFRIPEDLPKIILINNEQKTPADLLRDGDTLSIFPPIAGG